MFDRLAIPVSFHHDFQPNQMKQKISSKPNGDFVSRSKTDRSWVGAKLRKIKESLFQPVDALPLGIFRFLFGFLLCIEFFVVSRESFPEYYIKPLFHFTYPLFDVGYHAGSVYATVSYRFYFDIRIFLFHGELCLQQSLLPRFFALIFDVLWPLKLRILPR